MEPVPHLCDLPPEDLDRMAQEHLEGVFAEVRAAAEHCRAECRPLTFVRKHPVAVGAAVGVAGFALAYLLRGRRRSDGAAPARAAESVGRTFYRSLVASLAGSAGGALPELVLAFLRSRASGRAGEPPS